MSQKFKQSKSISYKDAGVDIEAGDQLVKNIKPFAKMTSRKEVIGGLGGFGSMFEIPEKFKSPVLVSGTDGVGTKLKLAVELNSHETIGQDLVAMCVNDILVQGAEPLFFLDYFACGSLKVPTATKVIKGIADGNGEVSKLLNVNRDKSANFMGMRCARFAMIIDNNNIINTYIEDSGKLEVSTAEYILEKL